MKPQLTAVEFYGHDFPHPEYCSLDKEHPCLNGPDKFLLSKAYAFMECEIDDKTLCKLIKCKFYKEV